MEPGSDGPHISVVIPTYNRAHIIGRALASVLSQSYPASEVIVVDDGSTDNTAEVIGQFGGKVRLVHQNHGGPSRARNLGVAEAASPWIAFLDSDDAWYTGHLSALAGALTATQGQAALYFDDAEWETSRGVTTYWKLHNYTATAAVDFAADARPLVYREVQPMLLPFILVKKEAYQRSGGLWEKLWSAEDTHLFIRLGTEYPFCAVNALGGRVVSDAANENGRLTTAFSSDSQNRWKSQIMMFGDLLSRFPDLPKVYADQVVDWLAESHWRLSRIAFSQKNFVTFVEELLKAIRTRPNTLKNILLGNLRGTR
jgi:glycosyltransferase involved in cell wall biosynthesis